MADSFHLLIVVPGRTIYDGKAESAMMPAAKGMMGVLPGHAPFYGTIEAGTITARTVPANTVSLKVSGGTVEVLPDDVTILVESLESSPQPSVPNP
ncbi:MAG TPA: hypothetical protein VMH22_00300 [bacterium]|nr:hypothetical protein [bacterium]